MYGSSMVDVAGCARFRAGSPCSNSNAIVEVLEEGGYDLSLELKLATTKSKGKATESPITYVWQKRPPSVGDERWDNVIRHGCYLVALPMRLRKAGSCSPWRPVMTVKIIPSIPPPAH